MTTFIVDLFNTKKVNNVSKIETNGVVGIKISRFQVKNFIN